MFTHDILATDGQKYTAISVPSTKALRISRMVFQNVGGASCSVVIFFNNTIYQRVLLDAKGDGYESTYELFLPSGDNLALRMDGASNVYYTIDYSLANV